MPDLKIYSSPHVRKPDFEAFAKDLELFLEAFTPQLLANWIKKDKANLSKKLNGLEPITRNDIRDFYVGVSSVLEKLKNGIHAFQIELEMNAVEPEVHAKNLWEEIRLIQTTLREHSATLQDLKDARKGPQNAADPQNS